MSGKQCQTTTVSSRGWRSAPRDPASGLTLSRSIARLRQGARCPRLRKTILHLVGPSASCANLGMTAALPQ